MHRHTTNSISTASAVLLALRKKKAYFKTRSPGTKWGLQYQLPLMGERGSRRTPHFQNSLAFSFISAQYVFLYYEVIRLNDEEEFFMTGLMQCRSGRWRTVRTTFIFFFWFPFFPIYKISHLCGAQLQFAPALYVVLFSVAACGWNIGLLKIDHLRTI